MKPDHNKPQLNEKTEIKDLFEMQTEVALFRSMMQSKTLSIMVIVGVLLIAGLLLFLFHYAK